MWKAAIVAALLAIPASSAQAGTYDVVACDAAGGANNSWVPVTGNQTTAYSTCPTGGDPWRGMIARNVVVANTSAGGNVIAQMRFDAPPGTSIVGLDAAYDFYRSDAQWEAALSTGSQVLVGCPVGGAATCGISNPGQWIGAPAGTQTIYLSAYCPANSCPLAAGDAAHNYLSAFARLASASVRLRDDSAPAITAVGGGLWTDGWKSGSQSLTIDASDNSGIRQVVTDIDGQPFRIDRVCDATRTIPCPSGADTFNLVTSQFADGGYHVVVRAVDAAGNSSAVARDILVDNSPPGPVRQLAVEGGDGWKSKNSFDLHWANPVAQGAPNAGVNWQICPASGAQGCVAGSKDGADVQALNALTVPKDGDWTLKLWARDAAGNNTINNGVEAHLRSDTETPTAVFAPINPADPTRVVVQGADAISGIGSGAIDFKPQGSETWTSMPAKVDGGRLSITLPDETLADGPYDLRAHAVDRAGNERSTTTLSDGTPMTVTLPLRSPTKMIGGRLQTRRRAGKRVRYLATRLRLGHDRRTRLEGRLADREGKSMAGAAVTVAELVDVPGAAWRPLRALTTTASGTYSFRTGKRGPSRTVRIRYEGTPTVRPSQVDVHLAVAAASTIHTSRRHVRSGHAVRFRGTLRGGYVPVGKTVQLQAKVRGRWQTFANPHVKRSGAWTWVYKFTGTPRRHFFRVRIPSQANYPFRTGHSKTTTIVVGPG